MVSIDVIFCRRMLSETHALVKIAFPDVKLKDAWVWHSGRIWEFHGPDGFYWHGRADNAYDARVRGWNAWLSHKGMPQ